ncbi:hypothetical protein [Nocardiopsis coralliicola]
MDHPTLEWISEHLPAHTATAPQMPAPLLPAPGWFTSPASAVGIHGIGHNARVSALAGLMARLRGLDKAATDVLRLAGAVHDCRRLNDRSDPHHGNRAALWLKGHHRQVTSALGLRLEPDAVALACTGVGLHNVAYEEFTPPLHRARHQAALTVDLLKAADCLDRYRLPARRWWPDTSHLRVEVPEWLHHAAAALMLHSERDRLRGAEFHDALFNAHNAIARSTQGGSP